MHAHVSNELPDWDSKKVQSFSDEHRPFSAPDIIVEEINLYDTGCQFIDRHVTAQKESTAQVQPCNSKLTFQALG